MLRSRRYSIDKQRRRQRRPFAVGRVLLVTDHLLCLDSESFVFVSVQENYSKYYWGNLVPQMVAFRHPVLHCLHGLMIHIIMSFRWRRMGLLHE